MRSVIIRSKVSVLFLSLLSQPVWADQPETNNDQDKASANGRFVIEMRAADYRGNEGRGIVYEKTGKGKERRWSVDWFANKVELSNSGDHLIRYGPWGTDLENHTDMAVAFYHQGKLLKQYQVRQLIKDTSKLDYTVSHYEWIAQRSTQPIGFSPDDLSYHLVLADKTAYDFDVNTGLIVRTSTDAGAMNGVEIWEAEKKTEANRGIAIYKRSPLPALYEPHFTVTDMDAGQGKRTFDFPELEWRATLIPKKNFLRPVAIEVSYPRREDDTLATIIPAADFLKAIPQAMNHPWVVEKLSADPTSRLELNATGSHLWRSKKEVDEFIKALQINEPGLSDPDGWAEMGVRTKGSYRSFWIHLAQRWLVYEDGNTRQFPWPYDLLDAKGRILRHTRQPEPDMPTEKSEKPLNEDPFAAPSPKP